MAADLNLLTSSFKSKVETLLSNCRRRGVEMRPYYTLRSPFDQAKLWRQSRSTKEIEKQIAQFKTAGADFLAHCLESVGPQHGNWATNCPPGYSWHEWGEAVDCFWVVSGNAEWSATKIVKGINGYKVYAGEAKKLGLDAGGNWSTKDWCHVQLRATANASKIMSVKTINDRMKAKFGK